MPKLKKPKNKYDFSAYQGMWLFAIFDLPVGTTAARRAYSRFRNELIRQGFMMLQLSVYARYCATEDRSDIYRKRLQPHLPAAGEVRLLAVTDRQFGKMEVFVGKTRKHPEDPPEQLLLF